MLQQGLQQHSILLSQRIQDAEVIRAFYGDFCITLHVTAIGRKGLTLRLQLGKLCRSIGCHKRLAGCRQA